MLLITSLPNGDISVHCKTHNAAARFYKFTNMTVLAAKGWKV